MTTSELPTCPTDGKPIHDGAFLCPGCVKTLRVALRRIMELRPELEATITRQAHTRSGGRLPQVVSADAKAEPAPKSRFAEPPIPNEDPVALNLAASHAATRADTDVRVWVRRLTVDKGDVELPRMVAPPKATTVPLPSTGESPRWTRLEPWRPLTGTYPTCPVIPEHPTARGAWLLYQHLDWIIRRPAAPDLLGAMLDVESTLVSAVDTTSRDSMVIGTCPVLWPDPARDDEMYPCGGDVRAWPIPTGTLVELSTMQRAARLPKCMRCQKEGTIDWWHHEMAPQLSPQVTTNELIGVIAYELRWTVTHEQLRTWKHRGKIHALPERDSKGRTLWDHRAVLDAIRSDVHRQRLRGSSS